MKLPIWKNPNRTRNNSIRYTDKDYIKYYDLDLQDLTELIDKLRNEERLNEQENNRYRYICNYNSFDSTREPKVQEEIYN